MSSLAREARALAEGWAREAMQMLQDSRRAHLAIEHKAQGDWSSELDRRIEDYLRARIAQAFPGHGFLGEERGGGGHLDEGLWWVVDPIDGSVNYLRGYPQYAVSIALISDGEPIAACIGDPCRGEIFSAALGHGATLNGEPMAASSCTHLSDAIAATVFPKPQAAFMDAYLQRFQRVIRATSGVRRAGSMALELAYLAAGRVDCFWEHGMGTWDAAAGVLLVREAGGECSRWMAHRGCIPQKLRAPHRASARPGTHCCAALDPHEAVTSQGRKPAWRPAPARR